MKKYLSIISAALILLPFLTSCSQSHNLTVSIEGWNNDTVYVFAVNTNNENKERVDTLVAANGCITFDTNDTIEMMIIKKDRLRQGANQIESIILTPTSRISIKGKQFANHIVFTATGSTQLHDYALFRHRLIPFEIAADSINSIIEERYGKGDTQPLFDERLKVYEKMRDITESYVTENPADELSLIFTLRMPVDRFLRVYNLLADEAKHNEIFYDNLNKKLKRAQEYEEFERVRKSNVISCGNPAPPFTLQALEGNRLSLTDFSGRWTVLDFWGSWCGWCIKGIPDMKKSYERYKDKMEIISIACRDSEENWRKAVKEHSMPWTQLLSDGKVQTQYAVEGYPTKIIVDPQGIIAKVTVGEGSDFYTALDSIMKADKP